MSQDQIETVIALFCKHKTQGIKSHILKNNLKPEKSTRVPKNQFVALMQMYMH